jgi:glutamate synthase (NADPH/NADH) small chain
MGKPTGFIEFTRELPGKRPAKERVNDYNEFVERFLIRSSTSSRRAA